MQSPHSFDELYRQLTLRKIPFLMVFFVTIFVTYLVLVVIDFIPEAPAESVSPEDTMLEEEAQVSGLEPVLAPVPEAHPISIIIDKLDREVVVLNPVSREVADLDEALLSGVVRHPDSADFTSDGNMLILGHSSYLPNVLNKNFQAFNGLQTLTWGDKIRLVSADTEYTYRVEKVYEAKASEVFVPETPGEARLTLATCDSFGSKDDRFIVEAVQIDAKAL
jgi:LPXTG-site transpeptidase (sortase) family protein